MTATVKVAKAASRPRPPPAPTRRGQAGQGASTPWSRSPSAGGAPTGTVEIYKGTKLARHRHARPNGKVTIKVSKKMAKKLKKGKNTLTAKYLGSANVSPS